MDLQESKLSVIEQLLRVQDAQLIEEVKNLLDKENNPIVGYSAKGEPITRKEFVHLVEEAEEEYTTGKYQTVEELKKEAENW